ncbi:DNA methylase [Erythrobacter phage vB_EliS_R6L]|nr:DNA methylase [Erythrobacter phage vB_EliS_R6L]
MTRAIGSHHSSAAKSVVWLTPPGIIESLGGWQSFDLDPCAAPAPRPWSTAQTMNGQADANGLLIDWFGRVWLNPPYSSAEIVRWLRRLADHGRGTALIFARTETEAFRREVWERAHGLLFLYGRLHFHSAEGRRAVKNSGAPSVLCAYGQDDLDRLAASGIDGALVPLRLARYLMIDGLTGSWGEEVARWLRDQGGPVNLSDAYRHFARHPKARGKRHWQAKIRQQLQRHGRRIGPGRWTGRDECHARLPGL